MVLVAFGFLMYFMGIKVLENDQIFLIFIGSFFIIYIIVVLIVRHYTALPPGGADIGALSSMFSTQ